MFPWIQDPEASTDMNDESDTENDPEPDKSKRGNRWVHIILFGLFPKMEHFRHIQDPFNVLAPYDSIPRKN